MIYEVEVTKYRESYSGTYHRINITWRFKSVIDLVNINKIINNKIQLMKDLSIVFNHDFDGIDTLRYYENFNITLSTEEDLMKAIMVWKL